MRRRIALTILLITWTTLLVAGAASYWLTRSALLADLDANLFDQAVNLPELLSPAVMRSGLAEGEKKTVPVGGPDASGTHNSGRYVIRSEADQRTLPRSEQPRMQGNETPRLLGATFSTLADGTRVRSVTVRSLARPTTPQERPTPVVVTYSGSAESFHRVLERLLLTFAGCGAVTGLIAAGIAYRISSTALSPLRKVSQVIGSISERRLDRRIVVDELPLELRPMAKRLNQMLGKLQDSLNRRRRFLANASHELRTPVAALVTGLEVSLLRDRPAEGYKATLATALTDASHLRALVERLMEQARSEMFEHDELAERTDIAKLLESCVASVAGMALPREISLRTECATDVLVRTQPNRLRSIVTNLLSNAVEYSRDHGKIALKAWTDAVGFHLTVRDEGMGISPQQTSAIFEPFFRGDAVRTAGSGHLGLGLFLVKTHVQALSGQITVQSVVGEGSEFRVLLPVVPEESRAKSPAEGLPSAVFLQAARKTNTQAVAPDGLS